jgi:DNA-binding transcriptional LysR family regulator
MDRLEAMSIVLAVAEAGSLSAAARQRKAPLATISRKVSELEAHLRTKLFNRSSRALVLTDAGSSFVAASKRILADVAEAERAASGEYNAPRGELNITAPVGLGRIHLIPVLADFLKAYPDVDVHLSLHDKVADLLEEHEDVALRIGLLADSSLIAVRVGEVRRVACASPDYLKKYGTPKTPDDLVRHDCVSYTGLLTPSAWTFAREKVEHVVPVRSRLVVSSAESACDAARAAVGVTVAFSHHVAESVKQGTLTPFLHEYQPAALPVSLVYASNRFMPIKLRAFLDFAAPRLKSRLADLLDTFPPSDQKRGRRKHASVNHA